MSMKIRCCLIAAVALRESCFQISKKSVIPECFYRESRRNYDRLPN